MADNFTNVKILSNPLKTLTLQGKHTKVDCKFMCTIPPNYIDINEGVWQIKVGNVYIEDKSTPTKYNNVMLIFEIKTGLVEVTLSALKTPLTKAIYDQHFNRFSTCRTLLEKEASATLTATPEAYLSFLATSVSTQQTLWSHAVTLKDSIPFYYFNPTHVGNEWFTIDSPSDRAFEVMFEQKANVALPPEHSYEFEFEITFLLKRML